MTAAVLDMAPAARRLPPLREELTLHPGPATADGAPSWTLQDPASGRFYRLGWMEFEILSRWQLGDPEAIAASVSRATPIAATADDVEAFARFLLSADLLRVLGEGGVSRLMAKVRAGRQGPARWLLKNYLFFRVPLLRPDAWLDRMMPWARHLFTPAFLLLVLACAGSGLFLAARQWDAFLGTFPHFLTLDGMVLAALTLVGAKAVHEMGHALTAKRLGCRVPTMGVAVMVLYPVLYTDVSEAWKLPSRRARLAVGAAGVAAELALAAFALLAWSFLPDGPLRSACFVLATTSWVLTLLVNVSPFMRFDGYFILSDWMDMPNLHERSFALARWWLRENLLGLGDPPPERHPPARRRFLIAFAVATWAYRLVLFLGIALMVYHLFFKALGILLFAVEIGWFVLRPLWIEASVWWRRRRDLAPRRNRLALGAGAALLLALLVPWRSDVEAPALLRAARQSELFAEGAGRVEAVLAAPGQAVEQGQPLLRLSSPDLDHRLAQAEREVEILRRQAVLQTGGAKPERIRVAQRELETALAERHSLQAERDKLTVTAPFAGRLAELSDEIRPGDWLPAGERLGMVVAPGEALAEAYVQDTDLSRLAVGATGTFRADDPDLASVAVTVAAIDATATRRLAEPMLSGDHGGTLATRVDAEGQLVPVDGVYRVLLSVPGEAAPARLLRGRVQLDGAREAPLAALWRRVVAVLVRESGF
ncbi:MAG TPA: HlyD family efflux transporter periplasmic adaptor subunit [Azospirillaceae bacterium]|nr:HlyD family efflux transporter periplasmic adaptor subunit [Azospirillaceae bacterium]